MLSNLQISLRLFRKIKIASNSNYGLKTASNHPLTKNSPKIAISGSSALLLRSDSNGDRFCASTALSTSNSVPQLVGGFATVAENHVHAPLHNSISPPSSGECCEMCNYLPDFTQPHGTVCV